MVVMQNGYGGGSGGGGVRAPQAQRPQAQAQRPPAQQGNLNAIFAQIANDLGQIKQRLAALEQGGNQVRGAVNQLAQGLAAVDAKAGQALALAQAAGQREAPPPQDATQYAPMPDAQPEPPPDAQDMAPTTSASGQPIDPQLAGFAWDLARDND